MRQSLKLHPDSRCEAVSRIDVDVERPCADALVLRFELTGMPGALCLPAPAAPARADGLWRHTCFEAFVRAAPGAGYAEFNFAPSTAWAAYLFDSYRGGMRAASVTVAPRIDVDVHGATFALQATLDGLTGLPGDAAWQLGLSAVIEERHGRLSYWALAHSPGKPDFHHADCFALTLPAPSPP
jgi:hypothetical protein